MSKEWFDVSKIGEERVVALPPPWREFKVWREDGPVRIEGAAGGPVLLAPGERATFRCVWVRGESDGADGLAGFVLEESSALPAQSVMPRVGDAATPAPCDPVPFREMVGGMASVSVSPESDPETGRATIRRIRLKQPGQPAQVTELDPPVTAERGDVLRVHISDAGVPSLVVTPAEKATPMGEREAHTILAEAPRHHLRTCGTAFRGCDPECPKEKAEQVIQAASDARVEAAKAAIVALSDEEWERARPRMCSGCFDRLGDGERCYCLREE